MKKGFIKSPMLRLRQVLTFSAPVRLILTTRISEITVQDGLNPVEVTGI